MVSIFNQPSLPGIPIRTLGFTFDRLDSKSPIISPVPNSGFVHGMCKAMMDQGGLPELWGHMFRFGKELEYDLEHNRVHTRSDGEVLEGIFLGLAYPLEDLPKGSTPRMGVARLVSTMVEHYLNSGPRSLWTTIMEMARDIEDPDVYQLYYPRMSFTPKDFVRYPILESAVQAGSSNLFGVNRCLIGNPMGNFDHTLWSVRYEHARG